MWKEICGYEGKYNISSCGMVKSLARIVRQSNGRCRKTSDLILANRMDSYGYKIVLLYKNKSSKNRTIHSLVAEAFIGRKPRGMQVNHKDGIKTNNNVNNLEYVTGSQNIRHAISMGLKQPSNGEHNGASKLSNEDVIAIRAFSSDYSCSQIIKILDLTVANNTISRIRQRKTWKHI